MRKLLTILATLFAAVPSLADEVQWAPPDYVPKVTYEDLARWPKKYQGHDVLLHGKVLQIEYQGNAVGFSMDISGQEFAFGQNAVIYWRQPDNWPNLIENDVVDVWGEFKEMQKFENAFLHREVTLPVIQAAQLRRYCKPGTTAEQSAGTKCTRTGFWRDHRVASASKTDRPAQ